MNQRMEKLGEAKNQSFCPWLVPDKSGVTQEEELAEQKL